MTMMNLELYLRQNIYGDGDDDGDCDDCGDDIDGY